MLERPRYGKYCGEHPKTKREVLPSGSIGLTIYGEDCEHRRLTEAGYQSFCSRFDRLQKGCEK